MPVQTRNTKKALLRVITTNLQPATKETNVSEPTFHTNAPIPSDEYEDSPLTPLSSEMEYDYTPPHNFPPPLTAQSTFNSIFDGPLTPLSDEDDSPDSSIPNHRTKFGLDRPYPSFFDETHNVLHFHPSTIVQESDNESRAPTHRSLPSVSSWGETDLPSASSRLKDIRHWKMGKHGLVPVEDNEDATHMDVVERERMKLSERREALMHSFQLIADDAEMEEEMTTEEKNTLVQNALKVKENGLGPEGTEIIDDVVQYRELFEDRRSGPLRMYPTLTEDVITLVE